MHTPKKTLLLLLVAILSTQQLLMAQENHTTDSIFREAAKLSTDTARVNFYSGYVSERLAQSRGRKGNMDGLDTYSLEALKLSEQTGYTEGKATACYNLGTICWHREDYRQAAKYYIEALVYNKELDNIKQQAFIAYLIGLCEYRSGMYGEALEYYSLALVYSKEANDASLMFRCYSAIDAAFFSLHDYASERQTDMEAIELARETGNASQEAEFSLSAADANKLLGDTLTAMQYYDRAKELYKELGENTHMVKVLINSSTIYGPGSPKKLALLEEAVGLLQGINPPTQTSLTYLSHACVNIGRWHTFNGNYQAAQESYNQAMKATERAGNRYQAIFVYTQATQFYFDQGKYTKAKQLAEYTIDLINKHVGQNHSFDIALKILSRIYEEEGNYRNAYKTLQQWSQVNDSIQAKSRREELEKANRRYEFERYRQGKMNEKEMDIQRHKLSIQKQHSTIIGLSGACFLLLLVGVLIYFYSHNLKIKNMALLERISEQDKLEQTNEILREQMARLTSSPDGTDEKEEGSELYLKLKELMKDPKVFTDPNISRKTLAELLNSNERYVHDTIRKYYDLSVSDYITNLRLNYARKLLAKPVEKYTIEAVAMDSGFSNRNTFHRLFKEWYGITPREFRQLAVESSEKIAS